MNKILTILISAFLTFQVLSAQTVQIQTVTNASAGNVNVNLDMLGFTGSNGSVTTVQMEIQYDTILLNYLGNTSVYGFGLHGGICYVSLLDDYIFISWSHYGSGINFNGTFLVLQFSYFGAFPTDLDIVTCEVSRYNMLEPMPNVTLVDGGISPLFVDYGKSLSISQVCTGGSLTAPYAVDVPVIADGLDNENVGYITLNFAYDPSKMNYTGFTDNQPGASWTVNTSSGLAKFYTTSQTGFTVNDGALLTLHFDFTENQSCESAITFATGSYMQETDGDPIAKNLYNGWISAIKTNPSEFGAPVSTSATVECLSDAIPPQTLPVIRDYCGNTLEPSEPVVTDNPGEISCHGSREYKYTYTDCAGNAFDWIYTYTILRSSQPAPVGDPVSNSGGTIECETQAALPTVFPVVEDVCRTVLFPGEAVTGGTFNGCEGTITYSYDYTDCAGLAYTWIYTYNVERTTAPSQSGVPVPTSGGVVACASDATLPATLPVVVDVCGTILEPGEPQTGGTYSGCHGTIVYSYTYTDCAGLQYVWNYSYTVDFPDVKIPENESATVACPSNAVAPAPPLIFDQCDRELTVVGQEITFDNTGGCAGTIVWTTTYEDCAEQIYHWNYTYTISPPVWSVPAAGGSPVACPADAELQPTPPTHSDNCGRNLSVQFISATATPSCSGTKVYTFRYTDCAGTTQDWTYTYTISPPVWNVPAAGGSTVACPADAELQPTPPTHSDNCGRNLSVQFISATATPSCSGTKVYTFRYTDCANNSQDWTYTYTISPPVWNVPVAGGSTVACPADAELQPTPPTHSDNCGRNLSVQFISATATPSCSGTKVYTFRYTDCANNSQDWTYTYNILPLTGPELVDDQTNCSGLDQQDLEWNLVEAEDFDASSLEAAIASLYQDNCGGEVTAEHTNTIAGENNSNQSWSFQYKFTVSDACNNTVICTVTYSGGVPDAPENINIDGLTVNNDDDLCYGATGNITVQNLLVKTGGKVSFVAANSVTLLPGIVVEPDGQLHAYISADLCENPAPLMATAIDTGAESSKVERPEIISGDITIRAYPNPTDGRFTLAINHQTVSQDVYIEIFNIMGESMLKERLTDSGSHGFDISAYPKGIYILRLFYGNKSHLEKIIRK
mgnify:CR=1 FL=1